MPVQLPIDREKIAEFCRRHHIIRLSLFGSVLRDDFRPDSDVDFLYVFHPNHIPGWDVIDIEEELARIIGRDIDFVSEIWLPPYLREQVSPERYILYENERYRNLANDLVMRGEACLTTTRR